MSKRIVERDYAKIKMQERLEHEGELGAWRDLTHTIRKLLKEMGRDERPAWLYAAREFPPKDGGPWEIEKFLPPPLDVELPPPAVVIPIEAKAQQNEFVTEKTSQASAEITRNPKLDALLAQLDPDAPPRSVVEDVHWVYHHALIPFDSIDPEQIPSVGALGMLRWVQANMTNYGSFMQIWAKLIPNSNKLEVESRFKDDGRKLRDIDELFLESLEENDDA